VNAILALPPDIADQLGRDRVSPAGPGQMLQQSGGDHNRFGLRLCIQARNLSAIPS
jgi:hypothetical protein